MGKHRGTPGPRWIIRCRDENGHRVRLRVSVTTTGVLLAGPGRNTVLLPGLAVGRLRGALRAAAVSAALDSVAQPARRIDPPTASACSRRRVVLHTVPGMPA